MSDRILKITVWTVLTIISIVIARYIILYNTYTLIATIVWSMLMVLYIKINYSKIDPMEKGVEEKGDP